MTNCLQGSLCFYYDCYYLFLIEGYLFYSMCWFLQNVNMNHPYGYPCPFLHEHPSYLPPNIPLQLITKQSLDLSSLSHTAKSHWLSIQHMVMYVSMLLCIHRTLSFLFPSHVHKVCSLCLCFILPDVIRAQTILALRIETQ